MADADKCYLLIPYKECMKPLFTGEPMTQAQLDLAAQRYFQNMKAIELRINDPDCQCPS